MEPLSFTHLHVHSDASLMDGLGSVDRLVRAAAGKGFKTLALTDHGTMANHVAFTIACEEVGIKPILGQEAYIQYDGKTGHITLLADGMEGFISLINLTQRGHAGDVTRKPAITMEALNEFKKGIICLTGCVASPAHWLPLDKSVEYVGQLRQIFKDRLFAEFMFVSDTDTWSRPLYLARTIGLKHVVTNDVHFPYSSDSAIHPILTGIKAGMTYNSTELWLKNADQVMARARIHIEEDFAIEGIQRAFSIGNLIKPVELKREPKLPHIPDADTKLFDLAFAGLATMTLLSKTEYKERVNYELNIIKTMGYSTYFLVLHDVIAWAKANGVRVGPGRGSGAGSLVLFLLGVTGVDPLKYELSFERFLHEKRKGYPDVDVDFDSEGRGKVIKYAEDRWGAYPVATYSTYAHSSLIHDLAKGFRISRLDEKEAADKGPTSSIFKKLEEEVPLFGQAYEAMLGQIRHKGKHAGGVIITDNPVPIERVGPTLAAAWTDGQNRQLSYAGIVKFDFLGLTALSALKSMEEETGERPAEPGTDDAVLGAFREGDLSGIFQFSGSSGIADLTRRVAPTHFDDLVAINALYRPGALDVGSADKYPEWKASPRKFHHLIDDILAPTYGAIVFQEQVMDIYARVTGGSLAEADMARRAIVKSKVGDPDWEREISEAKRVFFEGCGRNRIDDDVAARLWTELFSHVRYSFNKAHAVAYCIIAWDMMWWKLYHPSLFFSTMMQCDPTEFQTYLFDAAAHDIEILPPHLTHSAEKYIWKENRIYIPFSIIKYFGEVGAKIVREEREKSPFVDFNDFAKRIPRKRVPARARLGLYALGGFEGLAGDPKQAGIDTLKLDDIGTSPHAIQQKYLGAALPSAEVVKLIDRWNEKGYLSGIVVERHKKESGKFGPYEVHFMIPEGVFWVRGMPSVEIGKVVAVKVNHKTGKALKIIEL